jgi:hypothetical protein
LSPAFAPALGPYRDGARAVILGDLQPTSRLEFWRESNDRERAILVAAIAAERPDWIAVVGDLVFDGAAPAQWARFDALTAAWDGLPVLGAIGNHETWGGRRGVEGYFARLPLVAGRHWYHVTYGPLAIVVLDSNEGVLDHDEWAAQRAFLVETLAALDADPAIRGVAVLVHHPPFTNSRLTRDDAGVQRDLVPPFVRARKTILMQSGHVHSHERFRRDGKLFVVSGGGGGPRVKLAVGDARRHRDDLHDGPALRDFHYIVYGFGPDGLAAEVRGLAKGGDAVRTIDSFAAPYP